MPTYEIQMTHVNRVETPITLHVEAYDKIEAADYVNGRFGYPQEIAYSMHELARPLTAWEKTMAAIDAGIIRHRNYLSQLQNIIL